jgi:dTDP-4-dehydrorhamnose 3,5-epimerase
VTSWDAQFRDQMLPGGVRPLSIAGARLHSPAWNYDRRGSFTELFRASDVPGMTVAQMSCSISERGVIRGIHVSDVPPGRAKYVLCADGKIMDVVVDLRTGSPTFGQWEAIHLNSSAWQAVYLAPGLGHAFMALTRRAVMVYLHSTAYDPAADRAVNPLDTELRIEWPLERGQIPVLSDRDLAAPSLAQAREQGWLPSYESCLALETA